MPKPYPSEFREDVVRVARAREPGVTLEQVAADFGVHPMHREHCLRSVHKLVLRRSLELGACDRVEVVAGFREERFEGLRDRPSRPLSCPHRTPQALEDEVERLRRAEKLGPVRIAARLGMASSTVHRVLCRRGLNRLAWMDRPTGRVIRRIETPRTGELVHVDVKKLGRIPDGGGWRMLGRAAIRTGRDQRSRGMSYVHSAIDAYSRLAYSEIHDDDRGRPAPGSGYGQPSSSPATASPGSTRCSPTMPATTPAATAQALGGIEHRRMTVHAAHQREGRALQPHPAR